MTLDPQSINIVCVEDEHAMIELVRLILTRKGYVFHGAESGEEGLNLIKVVKPDLVLLDLMMPDMDGWEVYQQMKGDPEVADIPVIVITAKADNIDKILGLHYAKVNDYITKPFSPAELLRSIGNVLGQPETQS